MKLSKITSIKKTKTKVYDITVEKNHNFFCNNLLIHNCDYRGDIGVILINHGVIPFNLSRWSKIAQIIFETYHDPIIIEVKKLTDTNRGENGFGSTGI